MWNLKDINSKKTYITERLKNCSNPKEKEMLELSLICYLSLLDNSGTLRYTGFYNTMDKITQNRFSERREQDSAQLEMDLFFKNAPVIDDEYLQFLLNISNNILKTPPVDFDEENITTFETDYESILNVSHNFYRDLGDQEILKKAEKILNDESSINVSKIARRGMADCSGLTFNDYFFGKSYINLTKKNNLFDYQVLNHEVMHGVDFYMRDKVPSENYYGFHEVPTYTIDYLFIDYLEAKGMDINEVQKLRMQKDNYLQELAKLTQAQIKGALIRNKKYNDSTISSIKEVLNPQLTKQLLELESGVISYGLYTQIQKNKEQGLSNLKSFMKTIIPKTKTPNFSFINLDNQTIMNLSKQIGSYSMSNDINKQEKQGFTR
ncbi:MAG: hypothetical protein LKJ84_04220 [Bacilli bacterium]|nr:hypothetical protein [Bacilli bacterium]